MQEMAAARPRSTKGRRVPALDGIRGLAVAAVVAFHLGIRRLHGGLLGVDVFFVLSGYLITGLVLDEWRLTQDLALGPFWARRARRLLPALLVLILVVTVTAPFLLPADQLGAVRSDLMATLFYMANWHSVWAGHGYFAAFSAPSPLLHTWSLAVEEQFYILWPLVATIALRRLRSARWLLAISVTGAVGSALLMAGLSLSGVGPDRLYYGTDTRIQALFIGDALAGLMFVCGRRFTGERFRSPLARRHADGSGAETMRRVLEWSGGVAAVGLVFVALRVDGRSTWLYRGGFFLVAVAVAVVIASIVLQPSTRLPRVLRWRPLVALGIISYGVYLWHWPVIVVLTHERTGLSGAALLFVRLSLTLVISLLSFFLIEQPIRQQRWHIPRPSVLIPIGVAALAASIVVVPMLREQPAASAGIITLDKPVPSSAASPVGPTPLVATSTAATGATTTVHPSARPTAAAVVHPGPLRVMIVGDSVAASLGAGIAPLQSAAGIVFSNQGYIGCGIARGGATSFKAYTQPPACLTWPQRWQALVDSFRPDLTLVLLGRWEVLDRVHGGQWMHVGQPAFDAYLSSELELATTTLTSRGGRVAFLSAPCNNHELADLASPGRLPPDDQARVDLFNALQAKTVAAHPGSTQMVPFADLLCPGGQFVRTIHGVGLRTSDGVHLQPLAGRLFVQQQLPSLLAWLRPPGGA
ncbi:MAG: acyltransferase family protein [Acidimicrobiales bacterium]